MDGRNISEINF